MALKNRVRIGDLTSIESFDSLLSTGTGLIILNNDRGGKIHPRNLVMLSYKDRGHCLVEVVEVVRKKVSELTTEETRVVNTEELSRSQVENLVIARVQKFGSKGA